MFERWDTKKGASKMIPIVYETHTTSYEQHRDRIHELADFFATSIKLETESLYRSGLIDPAMYSRHSNDLGKILVRAAIERTKDDGPLVLHTQRERSEVRNLEKA
jgi:hypothetical protein